MPIHFWCSTSFSQWQPATSRNHSQPVRGYTFSQLTGCSIAFNMVDNSRAKRPWCHLRNLNSYNLVLHNLSTLFYFLLEICGYMHSCWSILTSIMTSLVHLAWIACRQFTMLLLCHPAVFRSPFKTVTFTQKSFQSGHIPSTSLLSSHSYVKNWKTILSPPQKYCDCVHCVDSSKSQLQTYPFM